MNKFKKLIYTSALVLIGVVSLPTVVSANTTVGGGGGAGGTGSGEQGQWIETVGEYKTSKAYNEFLRTRKTWTNYSNAEFSTKIVDGLDYVSTDPKDKRTLSQVCSASQFIWSYRVPGTGAPTSRKFSTYAGSSHKSDHYYYNTQQKKWIFGSFSNQYARGHKVWRWMMDNPTIQGNSSKGWLSGHMILMCSDQAPDEVTKPEPRVELRTFVDKDYDNKTEVVKGPVTYQLTATPVRPSDWSSMSASERNRWTATHVTQTSPVMKTEFGKYLDRNPWANVKTEAQWKTWKAGAEKALAASNPSPEITFNSANQQGLNDGAIFTITQSGVEETFTAPFSQAKLRSRVIETYYDAITDEKIGIKEGPWTPWRYGETVLDTSKKTRKTSNLPSTYYQILTVRCNPDEYNAALRASGGTKIAISDGSGMGAIRTPKTTNANALPFGKSNHSNAALRKTAYYRFFTQTYGCENNFKCAVTPQPGATNGSETNFIASSSTSFVGQGSGVVRGDRDKYEFFRDNESVNKEKLVQVNVWYPKTTGKADFSVNSKAPGIRTKVAIDPKGTPAIKDVAKFTLYSPGMKSGKRLTTNSTVVSQHISEIETVSGWSSNEGAPHRVHMSWVYQGNIKSRIPTKVNNTKETATVDKNATVDLTCAMQKPGVSADQKATLSTNTTDRDKPETFSASRSYIEVIFNRAISSDNKR